MESKVIGNQKRGNVSGLLTSSGYAGLGAGALGSTWGAGYATLKGRPVILWTLASGAQCFVIGSAFWLSRGIATSWIVSEQRREALSFSEELVCSTISGSVAGVAGASLRGFGNVVPGAIACGLIGLSGQVGFSALIASNEASRDRRPLLDRLSDSRWWPLKSIPDAEYRQQLLQQIDALDVEISMVDDQISALKQQREAVSRKG